MFRGRFHLATALVLLFTQVIGVAVGGSLMVRCLGADGHDAVEWGMLAHCDSGDSEATGAAPVGDSLAPSGCTDALLAEPLVLRPEQQRFDVAPPVPVAYVVRVMPDSRFGLVPPPAFLRLPVSPHPSAVLLI